MSVQPDLFGNENPVFATAKERYGLWPTTVWDIDYSDPFTKELKRQLGDGGEERDGSFTQETHDASVYRGKVTASVFSPSVTQYALNCFAPDSPAQVFDPFGGGGTRAVLSALSGYDYLGVELRANEVEAVRKRIDNAGVTGKALVVQGDSRDVVAPTNWADFIITCPPYYDLEQYDGGPADLSMLPSYGSFLKGLDQVVEQTTRVAKPGAVACWVVGLLRDAGGTILPLHHDVVRLHAAHGWSLKEEVVLRLVNNGAIQRIGQFDKGDRRLVRVHEYLLVMSFGGS
jgi:hypothetical protein